MERDFYPCNCKYKICYSCYDIQVTEKEHKCPNCFLHYKVQRVEEYKQSRLNQVKSQIPQTYADVIKDTQALKLNGDEFKHTNISSHVNHNYKQYKKKSCQELVPTCPINQNANKQPFVEHFNSGSNQDPQFVQQQMIHEETKVASVSKQQNSNEQVIENQTIPFEKSLPLHTSINEQFSQEAASNQVANDESVKRQQCQVIKIAENCMDMAGMSQAGQPLVGIEQSQPKIRTDEHIPIRGHEATEKLIENGSHPGPIQDMNAPTIHQKYDLVSKNTLDHEELESNLKNCKFQHQTGPEPIDSECMDMVSMRSSQTQNWMNHKLMYSQAHMKEGGNVPKRRTNSQENILTSTQAQFLQQFSSQSGYSIPEAAFFPSLQGDYGCKNSNLPSLQRDSYGQIPNMGSLKGMKLNRMRIIQKTTIYVIGISPLIADQSIMKRYEYFGQYGEIQNITLNNQHAFNQLIPATISNPASTPGALSQHQALNTVGDASQLQLQAVHSATAESKSTSSNRSQVSYAAYITYQSAEEASVAILALDQFIYDGRMIRASYGRTKYCKFFLKKTPCLNKDCPYQHYESKESDIITPDDMQNKQLFQYCQQLALGISKILEVTESQFKIYLKDKRERLPAQNHPANAAPKHILPKAESIFENKELQKKINQIKQQTVLVEQSKRALKQTLMASLQGPHQINSVRIDNLRKISNQDQKSDRTLKSNNIQSNKLKIKKQQTLQLLNSNTGGDILTQQPNLGQKSQHQQYVNKSKRVNGEPEQKVRQPRSGSHRENERVLSKQKLQIIVGGGMRQSVTPRRHSYSRMLSQQRKEVQLGDMKKSYQKKVKYENSQSTEKLKIKKGNTFLQNQVQKVLQKESLLVENLKSGNEQYTEMMTSEQSGSVPRHAVLEGIALHPQTNGATIEDHTQRRASRLVTKQITQQDLECKHTDRQGNIDASRASRNRILMMHGDRRKSVSKSIQRGQRDSSISSFIDHTLKFLNDDMAIPTKTMRDQEPLIERIIENDSFENQSQINRMIFQNQLNINDQLDSKSGFFSNGESRGHLANQENTVEINLQKINNIYTSPFFLINSQNHCKSEIESVYRIWENFDSIENAQTLNAQNSASDQKVAMSQMDSQSFQDQGRQRQSLLVSSMRSSANPSNKLHESQSINLNNKNQGFNVLPTNYSTNVMNVCYKPSVQQNIKTNNMTLTSKPFFKTGQQNMSANNSTYGQYAGSVNHFSVNQQQKSKELTLLKGFQPKSSTQLGKSKQFLQMSQQLRPFMADSTGAASTQQANLSNQKQLSAQNQATKYENVVLNEKNLFIFDNQQDGLFDKQQYWNQIFLPQSNQKMGEKAVTDIGNSRQKGDPERNSTKLLTSQSVFSFPLGIEDDQCITPLRKLWDPNTVDSRKSNENIANRKESLEFNQQKRKSMYQISNGKHQLQNSARGNNEGMNEGYFPIPLQSLTPQKQNRTKQSLGGSSFKPDISNTGNEINKLKPLKKVSTISDPSSLNKNHPFKIYSNNIKCAIDGKSAGDELGTPGPTTSSGGGGGRFRDFYREFVKVNDLFGGVPNISSVKMRRNSCSKSQSHSRVRMQPSIYHDGNEEEFKMDVHTNNRFRKPSRSKERFSNEWNFKVNAEDDQISEKIVQRKVKKCAKDEESEQITHRSQNTM